MKKLRTPPTTKTNVLGDSAMVEMNEALVLGSVRQHQLTRQAVALNVQLELEIAERQRAEDSLRISEVRYRRLFEAATDGLLLVDPVSGSITDANPFIARLSGHPLDQLIGMQLWKIGLLKDEAASREMFETLKRDRKVFYEDLALDTQSGRHLEVEVVANLYEENSNQIIQCNIRDITDRKRAEEILRRNEELFSTIIELAPVGVYVLDARFQLQQVNPNALPSFSNLHPLIGRDFSEVIHVLWPNPAADELVAVFRHTLETGEPYHSTEFIEQRRDIDIEEVYEWQIQRVILPTGENGVVCFFNNITERKNAEAAQRKLDVLTASNLKLKKEIVRRQAVEESLHQSQELQILLLEQSRKQEELLRDMSHRILSAQEEERKRISRELHDVISQNLIGINVSMDALSKGDLVAFSGNFRRKITEAQRIVESTVDRLHHFARELRPSMLDDLGLIPALQTLLERFMEETGIRSSLTAFAGIEESKADVLTVLYRIAQEALANVSQHAQANQVEISITTADGCIQMEIQDDGTGIEGPDKIFDAKIGRLGLLGMKERVEMVGGSFQIESLQGEGTVVRAVFSKPTA